MTKHDMVLLISCAGVPVLWQCWEFAFWSAGLIWSLRCCGGCGCYLEGGVVEDVSVVDWSVGVCWGLGLWTGCCVWKGCCCGRGCGLGLGVGVDVGDGCVLGGDCCDWGVGWFCCCGCVGGCWGNDWVVGCWLELIGSRCCGFSLVSTIHFLHMFLNEVKLEAFYSIQLQFSIWRNFLCIGVLLL